MLAIIPASGQGSRLSPLTNDVPKPLVEVCGRPLLAYQLDALGRFDITKCIITTGPFAEQIMDFCQSYPGIDFLFVNNPSFANTNYSYSLWLSRDEYREWSDDDEVVLMHSDLIFENEVFDQLITSDATNGVITDSSPTVDPKDFCGRINGDSVTHIDTAMEGEDIRQIYPIYRFSASAFDRWFKAIDDMIHQGGEKEYAEMALNDLLPNLVLRPVYIDEFCSEVDTQADIEHVESVFCP